MANITFSFPPSTIHDPREYVPKRQLSGFAKDWVERGLTMMKRKKFIEDRPKWQKLAKEWGWNKGESAVTIIRKMRNGR